MSTQENLFLLDVFAPETPRLGEDNNWKKRSLIYLSSDGRDAKHREIPKNHVFLIIHTGKHLSKKAQNRKQSSLGECMTP